MTTANGEMDLDYFLEPDATYRHENERWRTVF